MSNVQVIEAGRRYRSDPPRPTVEDVFDFAEALIEQYGLNKVNPETGTVQKSSDRTGYTLHDAIGEFGTRLSPDRSKGAHVGAAQSLRDDATDLLMELINQEGDFVDDKAWENAPGRTQQQVIDLLRRAREEAARRASQAS